VSGTDDGIKRRLCVIPWRVTFDGSRRDSTLKERLCADGDERGGILNWAIAGLRAWQIAGLAPPDCVRASTEDFTRQQDTFGQFLDERCEIDPGMRVESGDFYREFTQWLESRRESTAAWTSNRVANELVRRNFVKESRRTGGIHRGKYFYAGVGLLSAHDR
jgi:putative DNA primase/helicase